MGIHNIIIQEIRTQLWLEHKTFHQRTFDEQCVYCEEELEKAQADHIAGEVLEQELEDREELEND
jgi:uncharacterized protein with PIN domain